MAQYYLKKKTIDVPFIVFINILNVLLFIQILLYLFVFLYLFLFLSFIIVWFAFIIEVFLLYISIIISDCWGNISKNCNIYIYLDYFIYLHQKWFVLVVLLVNSNRCDDNNCHV